MGDRVLVVTNDFPPVLGGIEAFAARLTADVAAHLPPGAVTVLTREAADAAGVDAGAPFRVLRHPVGTLLPTPSVARLVRDVVTRFGIDTVWFPSAAPLGLLVGAVRAAGARTVVASTHGHEVWWSRLPAARSVLRRVADGADAVTYVSEHTRDHLLGAGVAAGDGRLVPLRPGVDPDRFAPDPAAREELRQHLGVAASPVVLAVTRLVRRKGIDVLLAAWPLVRRDHPGARLVVVGDGPDRLRVARLAARAGGSRAGIVLAGGRPWQEMPRWYAAADLFALPVRTRLAGLEPEAFGIAYLEAAAAGLPVVAGRSGGTSEAMVDGETGLLVDGRAPVEVARAVSVLLSAPDRSAWGARGRAWVSRHRTWRTSGELLRGLLRVG